MDNFTSKQVDEALAYLKRIAVAMEKKPADTRTPEEAYREWKPKNPIPTAVECFSAGWRAAKESK